MIVAEIGTVYAADHEVDRLAIILEHATHARRCGADAVKAQMFVPDEPLFCPMPGDDKRWERWKLTFMRPQFWWSALKTCREIYGIELFASAFQNGAVDLCNELEFKWHKVASRAVNFYPYAQARGEIIVSNGSGVHPPTFMKPGNSKLLFCVPKYPVPLSEAKWISNGYDGLSDHSGTPWPSLDALARGAEIIEVHFALDKSMAGNDAPVCLDRDQLKLICDFRNALKEMGRC